jgi:hypothetical protein
MGSSAALWLNRRELGTSSARHWLRLAPRQPAFTAPQYGTEPLGLTAGQQHAYRSQGQLPLRHLTFLHNTYSRPTCLLNVFHVSLRIRQSLQPSAFSDRPVSRLVSALVPKGTSTTPLLARADAI